MTILGKSMELVSSMGSADCASTINKSMKGNSATGTCAASAGAFTTMASTMKACGKMGCTMGKAASLTRESSSKKASSIRMSLENEFLGKLSEARWISINLYVIMLQYNQISSKM